MTDRKLLELAAKAAGIISDGLGGYYDSDREKAWIPLEDDGDALRLAVKRDLLFSPKLAGEFSIQKFIHPRRDEMQSLRRAIVVVAAGLAK